MPDADTGWRVRVRRIAAKRTYPLEQLVFELAAPEPPGFDNFLPGRNIEPVAALSRFARADIAETGVLIWGAAASGKTHLLRAAVAAAMDAGRAAHFYAHPDDVTAAAVDDACDLVAIDCIDEAGIAAQGNAFTLYNALRQRGAHLLAASRQPLAAMALREDLRTRLGWGLVYEVLALGDDEKAAALAAYAGQRGFRLSREVIDYLLRHGRRDMPSLLGALATLDRLSLAAKKPITVQMLRSWLQRDLEWNTTKRDLPPGA
jgi:DnaA family protein